MADPYIFRVPSALATLAQNFVTHILTLTDKRLTIVIDDGALRFFERVSASYEAITPFERVSGSYEPLAAILERVSGVYVE